MTNLSSPLATNNPIRRGFAAVDAIAGLPGNTHLARLRLTECVEDEPHRTGILAEITRHLETLKEQGEAWDQIAKDLERFYPILEIVVAGVAIQTANDDAPGERFYGGFT